MKSQPPSEPQSDRSLILSLQARVAELELQLQQNQKELQHTKESYEATEARLR